MNQERITIRSLIEIAKDAFTQENQEHKRLVWKELCRRSKKSLRKFSNITGLLLMRLSLEESSANAILTLLEFIKKVVCSTNHAYKVWLRYRKFWCSSLQNAITRDIFGFLQLLNYQISCPNLVCKLKELFAEDYFTVWHRFRIMQSSNVHFDRLEFLLCKSSPNHQTASWEDTFIYLFSDSSFQNVLSQDSDCQRFRSLVEKAVSHDVVHNIKLFLELSKEHKHLLQSFP